MVAADIGNPDEYDNIFENEVEENIGRNFGIFLLMLFKIFSALLFIYCTCLSKVN